MPAWVERGDGIETSFDAINYDREDGRDREMMKREIFWSTRGPSLLNFVKVVLFGSVVVLGAVVRGGDTTRTPAIILAAFVVLAFLFIGIDVMQRFMLRRSPAEVVDRFTLRLTPSALTCSVGSSELTRIATSDIAEVIGTSRLAVVTQHAKTIQLPCILDPKTHATLAADLNANVREARAVRGDYRGALIISAADDN